MLNHDQLVHDCMTVVWKLYIQHSIVKFVACMKFSANHIRLSSRRSRAQKLSATNHSLQAYDNLTVGERSAVLQTLDLQL